MLQTSMNFILVYVVDVCTVSEVSKAPSIEICSGSWPKSSPKCIPISASLRISESLVGENMHTAKLFTGVLHHVRLAHDE